MVLEQSRAVQDKREQAPICGAKAADAHVAVAKERLELVYSPMAEDPLDRLAEVDRPLRAERG